MPPQILVLVALIEMLAVTELVTVIVTPLEPTDPGLAQAALEVSVQVTTSLLAKVVEVNEDDVAPLTVVPFIFHT